MTGDWHPLQVLKQVQLLHTSLLPELQCVISQQTLELSAMRDIGGGAASSSGGGVRRWLWGTQGEEEERVSAAQQSVKAAIEMADAKLKATASNAAATGSAEILQKLAELEASGKDKSAEDANRGDALLARLEEMASYLEHMDGKMAEMRLEADERAQDQAKQLSLVHTKLDALLTGSHEQVFHYFILVPKPYKGYAGRAIDSLKPRNWFAKP